MNPLPSSLELDLKQKFAADRIQFVSQAGGCISNGGMLVVNRERFFLKWNNTRQYPGMYEAESKGLNLLANARALPAPTPITFGSVESLQYLILPFIDSGKKRDNFWRIFGEQLAQLHATSTPLFGLDHNNYIGSLPQVNSLETSWTTFFIEHRLKTQIRKAHALGHCNQLLTKQFDNLYVKLPSLLSEEKPSLLHGDLWAGNLITNEKGLPTIIDPAVYFGNREVDLAMTTLFGGFDKSFFQAYHATFPLLNDYETRLEIYKLYPLLVHLNLFGKNYLPQLVSILNRFV